MNPYGDVVHDHSRHPRNHGPLAKVDLRAEDVNPFCGDRVRIELALDAGTRVTAAGFQGDLCAIAKAASSVLTELVVGRSLEELRAFDEAALLHALQADLPPARLQCAQLPLRVLRIEIGRASCRERV